MTLRIGFSIQRWTVNVCMSNGKPLPEHLLTPNRCRQKFVFHPLMVEFTRFIHYLCVIRLISIPVSVVHRRFGQNPVRLDGIRIVRDQSKHATFLTTEFGVLVGALDHSLCKYPLSSYIGISSKVAI